MVDELIVPPTLAGLQIHGDEALGEQVVAGSMPPVEIRGRGLDREVHKAELLVDRDLIPDTDVSVHGPRVVLPGLVAELPGARDRVEVPQALPRAHVERLHDALRV